MNWQWVAGTGTDTRPNRVLNVITQARKYDPDGAYVRHWVPELAELEAATRHDVKAVEYLVRRRLDAIGLGRLAELVHFACTSEDVNNLAVAITVRDAVHDVWLPALDRARIN